MYHHGPESYDVAASEAAKFFRDKFEKIVAEGRPKAIQLIERIHTEMPRDRIVKSQALHFDADEKGVIVDVGDGPQRLHKNARAQLAERTTLGADFLNKNAESADAWRRAMAVECLHRATQNIGGRYLSRSVQNDVRALLSPRYRRIDGRPIVDMFAEIAIQDYGCVPTDGKGSDVRSTLTFALPHVFEPIANEVMLYEVTIGWSDFGRGRVWMRDGVTRGWCTNRATAHELFSEVHIGGELPDNVELSEKTMQLDTQRTISLMKDIIKASFEPQKVNELMDGIKRANESQVDWKNAKQRLLKTFLSKAEVEEIGDSFEHMDSILLPESKTAWRLSNALSLLSQKTEDVDRRMDMERLAGAVIQGDYKVVEAVAS